MRVRYSLDMPAAGGVEWMFPSPARMRLSAASIPENMRMPVFHEGMARNGYRVTLGARRDRMALRAEVQASYAGGLLLSSLTTNLIDLARTRSDVAADRHEWLVVYRARDTRQQFTSGSEEVIYEPGDIGVVARNDSFRARSEAGFAFDQLLVPGPAVRSLLARGVERAQILRAGDPMNAIVGSAMTAALSNLSRLPEPLAESVLHNIFALAALAAGPSEEGRQAGRAAQRAQQLETAKRHIERRLSDPDLSPADVAVALRISPRTLYALFESAGDSFGRYVLERRLARCREALTAPGASPLAIADLAFASGFNSLATFNRTFKRRFGQSPSDVRAESQSDA